MPDGRKQRERSTPRKLRSTVRSHNAYLEHEHLRIEWQAHPGQLIVFTTVAAGTATAAAATATATADRW